MVGDLAALLGGGGRDSSSTDRREALERETAALLVRESSARGGSSRDWPVNAGDPVGGRGRRDPAPVVLLRAAPASSRPPLRTWTRSSCSAARADLGPHGPPTLGKGLRASAKAGRPATATPSSRSSSGHRGDEALARARAPLRRARARPGRAGARVQRGRGRLLPLDEGLRGRPSTPPPCLDGRAEYPDPFELSVPRRLERTAHLDCTGRGTLRFRRSSWTGPVLHAFVRALADQQSRFDESLFHGLFAAAPRPGYPPRRGARRACSEPALPLLLAALHELARAAARLPSARRTRTRATRPRRRAAGSSAPEHVALLPSRGVRWGSGLEPPPHLVGERARALDVLAARRARLRVRGRARRGAAAAGARPEPIRLEVGTEPGIDGARRGPRARRLRARRAGRRARPVRRPRRARRRLPDHRARAAADRVLRRRDRGVRAFSPFTQRALHPVDGRGRLPGGRAPRRPDSSRQSVSTTTRRRRVPDDLVPPLDRPPDFVWQPDEVRARLGGGGPRARRA